MLIMATMNQYTNGTGVQVSTQFTDQGGNPTDPVPNVQLVVLDPSGNEITYTYNVDAEIVRTSIGAYYGNLLPTLDGIWTYRWVGAVNINAAAEAQFSVNSLVLN